MDYDQYDTWSENARLARIDYLDGKLTAEEFLRKIDTMHDLEEYTVGETQTPWRQRGKGWCPTILALIQRCITQKGLCCWI